MSSAVNIFVKILKIVENDCEYISENSSFFFFFFSYVRINCQIGYTVFFVLKFRKWIQKMEMKTKYEFLEEPNVRK